MSVRSPIAGTAASFAAQGGAGIARNAVWRTLVRLALSHHVLGWVDQAVVSAANFVSLVMIGRWTDPDQLGAYAVGFSILVILLATQESLVTRPYSIHLHQPLGTPAEHAFGSLALSLLLSGAMIFATCAVAVALSAFGAHRELVKITWTLAGVLPFALLRDFARRFAFGHLKILQSLTVDVISAALTIVALGLLGWTGTLSAATALGAVAFSCAIASAAWLYRARSNFLISVSHLRSNLQQSWDLGKWLLFGQLASQAQGYMTSWLAMMISGATVTGIYTACSSIVAFANPLLFGFCNILTPKFTRVLKFEGPAGLRRQAARDGLLLAGLLTVFCVVIFLCGKEVMHLLYPGVQYEGNGQILTLLAVTTLAAATGMPASIALASAQHARAVAGVMTITSALNVVLVWTLMSRFGLVGAVYGALAAQIAGSLGCWMAFLALVPNPRPNSSDPTSPTSA